MTDRRDAATRMSLDEYLALEYPFQVIADPDGGYVVTFPDLPGCITEIEHLDELPAMAGDTREGWLRVAYEQGDVVIPLPSYPEEYSGKFNVRLNRSLHRKLAETAEREGISLNSHVADVLARGDVQARIERKMQESEARIEARLMEIDVHLGHIQTSLRYRPTGIPNGSPKREHLQFVEDGYAGSVAA